MRPANLQCKQNGVTLLEALLVLAIGASILILVIQQYQQYKQQQDATQLQFNVDSLFQALGHYYKANCRDMINPIDGSLIHQGTLSPSSVVTPPNIPNSVLVDIQQTLIAKKYLNQWNPANPLVANVGGDYSSGYVVQFNPIFAKSATTLPQHSEYYCFPTYSSSGINSNCGPYTVSINNSLVLSWRAQVAVKINNATTTKMRAYKAQLAADCISSLGTGGTVDPCTPTSSNTGSYLVWERLPSMASPSISSALWGFLPYLKIFNLQYTHDPLYEYNNAGFTTYYTCGT